VVLGQECVGVRPREVERPPVAPRGISPQELEGESSAKVWPERWQPLEHLRHGVVAQAGNVRDVDPAAVQIRPSDQRVRVDDVQDRRGGKPGDHRAERERGSPPSENGEPEPEEDAPSHPMIPTA
jgi:hypothetical protein